jgi:hypothetical protein
MEDTLYINYQGRGKIDVLEATDPILLDEIIVFNDGDMAEA